MTTVSFKLLLFIRCDSLFVDHERNVGSAVVGFLVVTGHDVLKDDVTGRMHDDHRASLGALQSKKKMT